MTYIISMEGQVQAILYTLRNCLAPIPSGKSLIVGEYDASLSAELPNADFHTHFANSYTDWTGRGHKEYTPSTKYALICILADRQRDARAAQLAEAVPLLDEGAVILICADNDQGGRNLTKFFDDFGISFHSASKHKSRIIWATYPLSIQDPARMAAACNRATEQGQQRQRADGLWTQPGVFSWEHPDIGSRLLCDHLPFLKGHIGDYGCGIGEISHFLLSRSHAVKQLTLLDHDKRAILCAKENIKSFDVKTTFLWTDIADVSIRNSFDAIVMNPPFHAGKKEDVRLGILFIRKTAEGLKKSGALYMVANTHLSYERVLQEYFKTVTPIITHNGFKIIRAEK